MTCDRFQTDGMRFLDNEMNPQEKQTYEAHVAQCDDCARELKDLGRIVDMTNDLRLRPPDESFWDDYWKGIYRRTERGTGFLLLILGAIALSLFGIFKAVTSPEFLTFKGISITLVLLGFVIVFLSVVRERYHEHKSDPYKEVKQ
jgi:hypothetical protein